MAEKIYLTLLLLCGIHCGGIIGNLADEDIKEPSDILIRQKRVINRIQGEDQAVVISDVPYIVNIKERMRMSCVGSILSLHVVITISACVWSTTPQYYHVFSSSTRSDRGNLHNVTDIRRQAGLHPQRPEDGIALLTVNPLFLYGAYNANIQLHSGPLLPGMLGTVSGWGYNCRGTEHGSKYTRSLRSIEVPIMAHRDCVNIYRRNNIAISDKDICTYHPQKHCGHTDGGAPLVVSDQLVGVHLWTGFPGSQIDLQFPDVFLILQHSDYKNWISSNIRNIESQIRI